MKKKQSSSLQSEHALGISSPGADVPHFLGMPTRKARKNIKRLLLGVAVTVLLSTYLWTPLIWRAVGALIGLVVLILCYWWISVEFEVRRSQKVNLFDGAPTAGQERPRRSSMDLQGAFLPKRPVESASKKKKVCILRGNAGGGHIAALEAIKDVLAKSTDWIVTEVDMPLAIETHESNALHKYLGVTGEEMYNWCLAEGTFISSFVARLLSTVSRFFLFLFHYVWSVSRNTARDIWIKEKPDMVISVITMLNMISVQGLKAAGMGHVPYVTIVTDLAHSFVHPWLQCPEQYVVAGTATIRKQAEKKGYPKNKIFPVSGMVMRPSFYFDEPRIGEREQELRELNLDPNRRTCLIFYGGYAPAKLSSVASAVLQCTKTSPMNELNLIFICGKNAELKNKLDFMDFGVPKLVVGYTRNVPRYMSLSDFCVCKAGPAVVTEAAWFGLPLLIEHNMATLAQEKVVVDWAVSSRLAMLWRRQSDLPGLVNKLLADMGPVPKNTFRRIGHTIDPNHAIFEIPIVLNKIMQEHSA